MGSPSASEGKAEEGKQADGQPGVGWFRDNGEITFHEDRHGAPFKKDAGIIRETEDARCGQGSIAEKPVFNIPCNGAQGRIANALYLPVERISIGEKG